MPDLNANDLEAAKRQVAGTARSMGVTVDEVIDRPAVERPATPKGAVQMKRGKRYAEAIKGYDRDRLYGPVEAIELVKNLAKARFDETIELAVRLGVDPRRADQIVRGSLSLPAGTGRSVRVAVFAAGEQAAEARAAGADVVGSDDLVQRIEKEGFLAFDVAIATPDMMAQVGRLGRVLGPRGLMPNPKTGTVTTDIAKAVAEYKAGRVEYRTDRVGNIHIPIGKASFDRAQLTRQFPCRRRRARPGQAGCSQGPLPALGDRQLDHGPRRQDRPGQGAHHRRLSRGRTAGAGCDGLSFRCPAPAGPPAQVGYCWPTTENLAVELRCAERRSKGSRPARRGEVLSASHVVRAAVPAEP